MGLSQPVELKHFSACCFVLLVQPRICPHSGGLLGYPGQDSPRHVDEHDADVVAVVTEIEELL
jgi:hypothetical protein